MKHKAMSAFFAGILIGSGSVHFYYTVVRQDWLHACALGIILFGFSYITWYEIWRNQNV
ncbi:MAG: hypothetical protein JWO15_3555 [Sphingomonadales bacterium]|nr:hypothetical protein [Sphingomonadales bacterium]